MLLELGKHVQNHVILCSSPLKKNSWTQIKSPSRVDLRAREFWIWAYSEAKLLISDSDFRWIVHEYLSGITNFLLKLRFRKNVFTITSTYSVEFTFLLKRGWMIDKYSSDLISFNQQCSWYKKSLLLSLIRLITWLGSDLITGNSTAVTNDLKLLFPRKATTVLKTAVKLNVNEKNKRDAQTNFNMLYAGRINPPKGIGIMLNVLKTLYEKNYKFKFTIVGNTWIFEKIWFDKLQDKFQTDRFTEVKDAVSHSELLTIFYNSDLLILPSYYEGSPRIVKEALAYGTLVLCGDIAGTRTIDPKGEVLFYFDLFDIDDFEKKLSYIINDLTEKEIKNRKERGRRIIKGFSCEVVSSELAYLYSKIINS